MPIAHPQNQSATFVTLQEFATKTNTPLSIVDYIHQKSQTDFKDEFDGKNPSLLLLQNKNKEKDIYLYTSEIRNFVKRNFLMLQLLGLKKTTAQQLLDNPESFDFKTVIVKEKISSHSMKLIHNNIHQKV